MPGDEELTRRLEEFLRTRDVSALWPGLTEPARVAAARELERVVRAVLAGGRAVSIDPLGKHDAYALAIAGHTTGVGPLIGRWAEDRIVAGAGEAMARFADQLSGSRERAQRIERELLPALDALLARGITPVVLKGFHTSRRYFEEPGVRRMADVDLLVPPDRARDADAALADAGFRRDAGPKEREKQNWIGPSVEDRELSLERDDPRSKWTIELHTSLDRRFHPGAVAALDRERSAIEPFEVAGRRLAALAPELLLVSLACHCSQELDSSRLLRLVEIVRVIRIEANRLDWDAVLGIMERTGAARFTYPAFALVGDLAPGSVDVGVRDAGWRASTRAARHTVARLVPAGGSLDDRGVLRQLMWTRGPVAIAQRVARVFWPGSFLRPHEIIPGWRVRLRRLWSGSLSLGAPDERRSRERSEGPPGGKAMP
jgi:hypothetical protein